MKGNIGSPCIKRCDATMDRWDTYWQTKGCPRFLTSSLLIHSLSTSRTYHACEYTRTMANTCVTCARKIEFDADHVDRLPSSRNPVKG